MRKIFPNGTSNLQELKEGFLKNRTSKRFRTVAHYPKQSFYPINIEIFPTNLCNLRCDFCAYQQNDKIQLPTNIFQQLVDDILTSPIKSVTFSGGGEPLLYPNISQYINELSTMKDVGVITNGSIIPLNFLDVVSKCSWLRFSINQPTASLFTSVTGNDSKVFYDIKDNIQMVSEATRVSRTILGIAIIVTKDVEQDLSFYTTSINLASELSVNQIFFHKIIDGVAIKSQSISLSDEHKSYVNDYADAHGIVTNITKASENSQSSFQNKSFGESCELYDDIWKLFVTADGEVSPCLYRLFNKQERNESWGNIISNSLDDIIHSYHSSSNEFTCNYCKSWAIRQMLNQLNKGVSIQYPRDPHLNFI